jgi:hypothetical protein
MAALRHGAKPVDKGKFKRAALCNARRDLRTIRQTMRLV